MSAAATPVLPAVRVEARDDHDYTTSGLGSWPAPRMKPHARGATKLLLMPYCRCLDSHACLRCVLRPDSRGQACVCGQHDLSDSMWCTGQHVVSAPHVSERHDLTHANLEVSGCHQVADRGQRLGSHRHEEERRLDAVLSGKAFVGTGR